MNNILTTLDRANRIDDLAPARHTTIQRAAQALSRRNVDASIVELLNHALSTFTLLCYECDEHGVLINVDTVTGRILLPLPWGKKGYKKWGITPSESDVLRRIMLNRQATGIALFHYEHSHRSWYLNIDEYPTMPVLSEWELTIAEYRNSAHRV